VSDIFTEVDEEVRREQLKKLWERYGNYVVAAVILVIAAGAAWRGYDYWQIRKAAETGAAYDAAARLAEEGKHGEAEAAFAKIAVDGTSGYRVLARLREAAEIAGRDPRPASPPMTRSLAKRPRSRSSASLPPFAPHFWLVDTAKLDEMTQRLETSGCALGLFRHTARELLRCRLGATTTPPPCGAGRRRQERSGSALERALAHGRTRFFSSPTPASLKETPHASGEAPPPYLPPQSGGG